MNAPRLPLPEAYIDPAFTRCLHEAIGTPELVEQFNRLYGAALGVRTSIIEKMVDDACGKTKDDMRAFVEFVHNCIYRLLPDEAIAALRVTAQPEVA